jgi:predicted metal-dependent peptidase
VNVNALQRIVKARTALLLHHPFFAALLYHLTLVASSRFPTMATDGITLFYNPKFVEELPPAELIGTLAHEVMHPALNHHTRRGDRNPKLWNFAADYAINPLIIDAGLNLPKGILLNNAYRGMNAEAIYNLLARDEQNNQKSSGNGSSQNPANGGSGVPGADVSTGDEGEGDRALDFPENIGGVLDAPNEKSPNAPATQAQLAQQVAKWEMAVSQAATMSRLAGNLPAGVERLVEQAAEAKHDWKEHLRLAFSQAAMPTNYSWARPNSRFMHAGFYFPGVLREGVGEVVIAVDCSGWISDRILALFQAQASAIVQENQPSRVHIMYFDEIIHRVDTFEMGESITIRPQGGGGTSFVPIFECVHEQNIMPHSLIVLTDLDGRFPEEEPSYPVIWASTVRNRSPFGETVYLDAA